MANQSAVTRFSALGLSCLAGFGMFLDSLQPARIAGEVSSLTCSIVHVAGPPGAFEVTSGVLLLGALLLTSLRRRPPGVSRRQDVVSIR